jgi:hypothetical protein
MWYYLFYKATLYVFKTCFKTAGVHSSRIKSYAISLRERLPEYGTYHTITRIRNRTYETGLNYLFVLFNVWSNCVQVLEIAVQLYQNNYMQLLYLLLKFKENFIRTSNVNTAFSGPI